MVLLFLTMKLTILNLWLVRTFYKLFVCILLSESLTIAANLLGLSEKRVANAFWNGELEAELRERGALDMFHMYHNDGDREVVMEHIDQLRAKCNYQHTEGDCTEDCKARGK